MSLSRIATLLYLLVAAICISSLIDTSTHLALWPKGAESLGPMSFNIALIVLLFVVALIFLQKGKTLPGFSVGLLFSLFGLLLFGDYLFHQAIDANELFLGASLGSQNGSAQLSPSTALAILAMGIAIFSLTKANGRRLFYLFPALAAFAIIGISSLDILAGFLDLPVLGSGAGNRVESIVFFLLAFGLMFQVVEELNSICNSRLAFLPANVGGVILLLNVALWQISSRIDENSVHQKLGDFTRQQALVVLDHLALDAKLARKLAAQFPSDASSKDLWISNLQDAAVEMGGVSQVEVLDSQKNVLWNLPLKNIKIPNDQENQKWHEMREALLNSTLTTNRVQFSQIAPVHRNFDGFMVAAPIGTASQISKILLFKIQNEPFFAPILAGEGMQFDILQKGKVVYSSADTGDSVVDETWATLSHILSSKVNWSLRVRPSKDAVLNLESEVPALILVFGILLSLVMSIAIQYKVLTIELGLAGKFAEKKLNALAELVPLCLMQFNSSGDLLVANSTWTNLTGLSIGESLGQGWKAGVHSDDLQGLDDLWAKAADSDDAVTYSFRAITKEGTSFPISGNILKVVGGAQSDPEYVGSFGTT